MIGRVYKLCSKDNTYIGSTILSLNERLNYHHSNYKAYLDGKYHYVTSYEVIKDEHTIELLYEGEFETETHLHRMEGEYQRKIDCVNKCIAGRTQQEWYQDNHEKILEYHKQYRQDHSEKILEYIKQYNQTHKEEINKKAKLYRHEHKEEISEKSKQKYQEHKEEILEKAKQKFTCICGSVCRIEDKARHKRSKKHKDFLKFINICGVLGQIDHLLPTPMGRAQLLDCMFSPEWSRLEGQVL